MRNLTCPEDGSTVTKTARGGVLINVCPNRGIWHDRGELDKLLELVYLPDDANVACKETKPYTHLQNFFG